jgi:hypothetical protein
VLSDKVSDCSALFTNKHFPHRLESNTTLVEIVETHPLNCAHPVIVTSFVIVRGLVVFVLIVLICSLLHDIVFAVMVLPTSVEKVMSGVEIVSAVSIFMFIAFAFICRVVAFIVTVCDESLLMGTMVEMDKV